MKKLLRNIADFFVGANTCQELEPDHRLLVSSLSRKRPLPVGMSEFEGWSARIIEGAMLSATEETQKFALASMLLQLPASEAFKDDGFFINSLRMAATTEADPERVGGKRTNPKPRVRNRAR